MGAGHQESEQSSKSWNKNFVWDKQIPFLENLYGMAGDAAQGATGGTNDILSGIMPGMEDAFGNIAGLTDPSSQIAAQTDSLRAGLTDMFQNQLNPAITSNAVAAGGLGGGRQGVMQSNAIGEISKAMTQGMGDIFANANRTAIGAGGMLPGMMQGMTTAGMAGMQPLLALAQILGRPTVLSEGGSKSSAESSGWNFSFPGFGG